MQEVIGSTPIFSTDYYHQGFTEFSWSLDALYYSCKVSTLEINKATASLSKNLKSRFCIAL
jgi:hypothetical protein